MDVAFRTVLVLKHEFKHQKNPQEELKKNQTKTRQNLNTFCTPPRSISTLHTVFGPSPESPRDHRTVAVSRGLSNLRTISTSSNSRIRTRGDGLRFLGGWHGGEQDGRTLDECMAPFYIGISGEIMHCNLVMLLPGRLITRVRMYPLAKICKVLHRYKESKCSQQFQVIK